MVVTPAVGVPQEGVCAVARPVRLEAVLIGHDRRIALNPPAVLSCSTAAAIAAWIREDLVPLADATGSPLVSITVADSYSCRPRNRLAGAKPSAHGNGLAFDLGAMELADKRILTMQSDSLTPAARQLLKASACERFGTVLGQGSDGYHEDHLHVDLIPRRPGRAICQWTLPRDSKG
ncbi:extensin family protein [Chelatococcus asaccharovorans]|uniref:extensin family protein n=1 Tax=Chelatococcus asaccharovorans TaxID=28210 RepID=UPI00224C7B44|nr:extensin family protein [Chelatococcus asaccharovorans]CAH1667662.1 Extensin-like protein [Chelatococcus asaccharovorans]CAH1680784.1 Extensin-like protein [Chelatococcus asaccharovorans]